MDPKKLSFWSIDPTQGKLTMMVLLTVLIGFGIVFALSKLPTQGRKPITWILTFISGGVFVLFQYWPQPISFDKATQLPSNMVESVGSGLNDATSVFGTISQVLAAFMLGLGIFSILRIHGTKIAKQQKDWGFSLVLLTAMVLMIVFGFWDFHIRTNLRTTDFDNPSNWGGVNMMRDFLFEGLLQQMDAAMFSIIAFFILSAAYRAFRARSIEATILLGTALLVIISLMGAVAAGWDDSVAAIAGKGPASNFLLNFKVTEIANWIKNTFQTPSITGIKFGIGLGTLSMALRIWLGLERGGKS
ncbi:MAG: hypothetical protein GC165_12715 [Armatimonadetes bacterium]|nr:hypothetical protein [Armatimonadota bacterium]MBS1726054.1 hypothetical protein [Armatimonadota bacterium]